MNNHIPFLFVNRSVSLGLLVILFITNILLTGSLVGMILLLPIFGAVTWCISGPNVSPVIAKAVDLLRAEEKRLNLGGKGLDAFDAEVLAEALKINHSLTVLNLGNNKIGDRGARAIAKALGENVVMRVLDLRENQISEAGAEAIAEALDFNASLTELSLGGNQIGDALAQTIAETLKISLELTKLCESYPSPESLRLPIKYALKEVSGNFRGKMISAVIARTLSFFRAGEGDPKLHAGSIEIAQYLRNAAPDHPALSALRPIRHNHPSLLPPRSQTGAPSLSDDAALEEEKCRDKHQLVEMGGDALEDTIPFGSVKVLQSPRHLRGGQGSIVEVAIPGWVRRVAAKMPLLKGLETLEVEVRRKEVKNAISRMRSEAAALMKVDSSNVVRYLGFTHNPASVASPECYILMDFIEGDDLAKKFADTNQRATIVRYLHSIVIGILRGMKHAHDAKVVHLDLKPANILFRSSEPYMPLIADFGLARHGTRTEQSPEQSTTMGTLHAGRGNGAGTVGYMAPECFRGGVLTGKADVFAFGVILYELVTGQRAWSRHVLSNEDLYWKEALSGRRPAFPKKWPSKLKELISDCWRDEAKERPSFRRILKRVTGASASNWETILATAVSRGPPPISDEQYSTSQEDSAYYYDD